MLFFHIGTCLANFVKAPVFQLAKTGTNNVMKDEREKIGKPEVS